VEFRREQLTAELLDPRHGFQRARLPLEVRWDPLTGQSCKLLPEGSLPPPELQDLEGLAAFAPVGPAEIRAFVAGASLPDLHWEAATDLWPEAVAQRGRELFHGG
jgi:hypothetical protein